MQQKPDRKTGQCRESRETAAEEVGRCRATEKLLVTYSRVPAAERNMSPSHRMYSTQWSAAAYTTASTACRSLPLCKQNQITKIVLHGTTVQQVQYSMRNKNIHIWYACCLRTYVLSKYTLYRRNIVSIDSLLAQKGFPNLCCGQLSQFVLFACSYIIRMLLHIIWRWISIWIQRIWFPITIHHASNQSNAWMCIMQKTLKLLNCILAITGLPMQSVCLQGKPQLREFCACFEITSLMI